MEDNGQFALRQIDGAEADIDSLRQALTSVSFLTPKQLLVLKSPSQNKQFIEAYEQLLETVPEGIEVLIIEPQIDKRLKYYKFLLQETDFQNFPNLDQPALARWLSERARIYHGSLSQTDARYLIDRIGANQQLLARELEKLLLYATDITRQAINDLTEPAVQSTIFQLLAAAFSGEHQQTLRLYKQQRSLKVEPQQIIAMVSWQLHVLAVIKAADNRQMAEVARAAGLNPYALTRSQGLARQLQMSEVKQHINRLAEIDNKLKRSSIDADEALQQYLLSL